MFVKPAPGTKVRDPLSGLHIPDEGREVPASTYWVRLVADGSVLMVQIPQIPDSTSAKGKA